MVESPLERFLAVIETTTGKRPRRSGDGWLAHCPAHRDRSPSLSIGEGDGARVLVKCHAGCTLAAIVAAVGMTERDLFPDQANGHRNPNEPDASYDYVDEYGTHLFQVVRLPGKKFRQRRPDGTGGWVWKLGDTRRALYRSDRIFEAIETDTGATVWVVEGEKDAHSLERLGLLATTCPGGALKWRPEHTEQLKSAPKVVILPDADEPGRRHAQHIAAELHAAGAPDVRILDLHPQASDGSDASDWLAPARTDAELAQARALLEQLADQTPPYTPEQPQASSPADEQPTGHSWQPIRLSNLADRPPERPTLLGLVYPGRRQSWHGDSETAKSWLALIACAELARQGRTSIYIDVDPNGPAEIETRLRALGLTNDQLDQILYISPDEPIGDPTVQADLATVLHEHDPGLVVIDSLDPLLALHGLDANSNTDVERIWRALDPLRATGAPLLALDNVVKDEASRGPYAAGAGRKRYAVDVALGFERLHPLGRGKTGRYRITTHKDRPGHLPRPRAAELEIRSDPDTGRITWTLHPGHPAAADPDQPAFRPTVLMERVSRYLEQQAAPVSRSHIAQRVGGRKGWILTAVQTLIDERYARVAASGGILSERPFRDPEHTPSEEAEDA